MKAQILLVEDVADFREAFAFALETHGFHVVQATDGMEALALAKAKTPDAVILDIGLPRLDGFYVAELWRRDPAMKTVPVVALSAYTDGNYEERALRAGCTAALRKPSSADEVIRELERLLP
jgi:two-component system cell cycle response regulator DivK